jgi:hypothetical protein
MMAISDGPPSLLIGLIRNKAERKSHFFITQEAWRKI